VISLWGRSILGGVLLFDFSDDELRADCELGKKRSKSQSRNKTASSQSDAEDRVVATDEDD
jgi:hypothetical protein